MARVKKGEVAVESYHVLDGARELAVKGAGVLGLLCAQERAMRDYDKPTTLTVERRTLFGEPVILYRVVRDEDRQIKSYTINRED
jgi:hypothetical protein